MSLGETGSQVPIITIKVQYQYTLLYARQYMVAWLQERLMKMEAEARHKRQVISCMQPYLHATLYVNDCMQHWICVNT